MSSMKQDFDIDQFESRLENLKDTQEGIQQMSSWCLQHRAQHKKIVASWLNVFKKVRVEHRLVLFYLANDVIQYSKRKRYEFVESWATALQRATTMVRDDKVRNKIFRIFKIWEQRAIYSEEYLSDLSGLLSMNPSKKSQATSSVEVNSDEFQSSTLISNIRDCVELSSTTDKSFKNLPKAPNCDIENIKTVLKDKSHSEDVEKELERYFSNIETHRKHLAAEIKSRKAVLSSLEAAITFFTSQRGEVKVVVSAYKNFGSRIKQVKKKLDEIAPNLPSPLPSPDIDAPSPEPDADINLPDERNSPMVNMFKNAFNGYSSYLDGKLPFDINDFKQNDSPKKSRALSASQPIEVIASRSDSDSINDSFNGADFYKPEPVNPMGSINPYSASSITLPGQSGQSEYSSLARATASNYPTSSYGGHSSNRYNPMVPNYANDSNYISNSSNSSYDARMPLMPPPMPPPNLGGVGGGGSQSDDFNSTWDMEMSWSALDTSNSFNHCIDTPISPVHFDRDNILDDSVTDYDATDNDILSVQDVDHRQLHLPVPVVPPTLNPNKPRQLDIDHRNLISLTGSPTTQDNEDKYKRTNKTWVAPKDKDFRPPLLVKPPVPQQQSQTGGADVDYRSVPGSKSESMNSIISVPPPPLRPPPLMGLLSFPPAPGTESSTQENPKPEVKKPVSESKNEPGYDPSDMVESIDMDMSDEDLDDILREVAGEEKEKKNASAANEETQNSHEEHNSEEYIDLVEEEDEDVLYVPISPEEDATQSANVPVKVPFRDNLITVGNNRPPLLDTPPNTNNKVWENHQTSQGNRFPPNFEDHPGQSIADSVIHNNNMRPPLNPWKQPRMPYRMPGLPDNHPSQPLPPGSFVHPADFQHHQQFPRFPRSQFQQPIRNFGLHLPQNHFRGSPRLPRGNPFFKNRGRGGVPGGGPVGRGMFRGKYRGKPWQ